MIITSNGASISDIKGFGITQSNDIFYMSMIIPIPTNFKMIDHFREKSGAEKRAQISLVGDNKAALVYIYSQIPIFTLKNN